MDLFEQAENKKEKKAHKGSIEIFSRKKSRCSARYGTKRPVEKIDKQELLTAWREDL